MTPLILKRAPTGWNQEDYEVLEDGVVIGRVFLMPTREAAMAAFAKSWRK
jgi:hypothetical protein